MRQAIQAGSIVHSRQCWIVAWQLWKRGLDCRPWNRWPRCGAGLTGSEIIVRGNAGPQLGYGMQAGTIVIGGAAERTLDKGCRAGRFMYVGPSSHWLLVSKRFASRRPIDSSSVIDAQSRTEGASSDYRGYRKVDD